MTTGDLSDYGPGGLDADLVAFNLRRLSGRRVNVFDFMDTSEANSILARNYAFDSSSHVQAAIDAAFSDGQRDVEMAPGGYRWDNPVYLDPPGNLRTSLSSPSYFAMSLGLFGGGGWGGYGVNSGVEVRTYTSGQDGALYIGPGQGMYVSGLAFHSMESGYPMDRVDHGIMIAGGYGGASKVMIERCRASNYTVGFGVGFNADALGESTTWLKCMADYCDYGWASASSQSYIESLLECQGQNNNYHVYSSGFPSIQVLGGNYSNGLGLKAVSNCGSYANFNNSTKRFQATITSNTTEWPYFNIATFDCGIFGFVPCDIISYDAGTGVATFQLRNWFLEQHQFYYDLSSGPLKDAISACTKVYAAKRTVMFRGKIHVKGVHIESTANPQTVLSPTGVDAAAAVLENCFFNADPAFAGYAGSTDGTEANYFTQLAIGLIETADTQCGFAVKETSFGQNATADPINIIYNNFVPYIARFTDTKSLAGVNELGAVGYFGIGVNGRQRSSNVKGGAIFDPPANFGQQRPLSDVATSYYHPQAIGNTPFYGNRPAPWSMPRLSSADVASLLAASSPDRSLPTLHAEPFYNISDGTGTYAKYALVRLSGGVGWTYGSQLTGLNYAYIGGGHALKFTTGIDWMFVGLEVGIGGSWYIVNAVFPSLKLVHVHAISEFTAPPQLPGTAGTTYSGNTTLDQRPFNIRKYARQTELASSAPSGTWTTGERWDNSSTALGLPTGGWNASGTWYNDPLLYGPPQTGITAAGSNQSGATAVTYSEIVRVTTVSSGTGIKLPAAKADMRMFIRNDGSNPLTVYPTGSEDVNGTSSKSVTNGTGLWFVAYADGHWVTS